jgi:hypothetical protein
MAKVRSKHLQDGSQAVVFPPPLSDNAAMTTQRCNQAVTRPHDNRERLVAQKLTQINRALIYTVPVIVFSLAIRAYRGFFVHGPA